MIGRIAAAVVLVYLIPCILFFIFAGDNPNNGENMPQMSETVTEDTSQIVEQTDIAVLHNGEVIEMPLEEYVLCVTLAEVPGSFEVEALKAQAVVARTFTCKRMDQPKHENCPVCTDSGCCQAYISVDSYLNKGGTRETVEKVKNAVDATAGQVLMYQGSYIEATYFSCSGGRTEDALAVWGNDVPYLQSVESPGEEMATHYTDTVVFSKREFLSRLGLSSDAVRIENISYTDGGGVASVTVCGKTFSGTKIRSLLELRSTAFAITPLGDNVTVTTKGFGHRVGLSQYGAEAMAVQGKTYVEILSHYYQGTELVSAPG